MGPNRTKVVTPNSSLKFTPEELLLYCRDLRVICFLFDRLTPDAQVIEVSVFLFLSGKRPCLLVLVFRSPAVKLTRLWFLPSDHLHHRQDLPAPQAGLGPVLPERCSGERG